MTVRRIAAGSARRPNSVPSGKLISRQEVFRVAVVAAFAPFYNHGLYGKAAAAGA